MKRLLNPFVVDGNCLLICLLDDTASGSAAQHVTFKFKQSSSAELENYLDTADFSGNPLDFWRVNGDKFPRLCVTAKQVFCAPGSTAAVERIFSIAGYILSQRQNRLTDSNFENQLFANVNFDIPVHSDKKLRLDN